LQIVEYNDSSLYQHIEHDKEKMDQLEQAATITVEEAHQMIGKRNISRASIYNALRRNDIPNVRVGVRRILIPRHAFLQWLQGQGAAGAR
jgi:excisionase family DNA binding protein